MYCKPDQALHGVPGDAGLINLILGIFCDHFPRGYLTLLDST